MDEMNCDDDWPNKQGKNYLVKIYFKKPAIASALVVYLARIDSSMSKSPPMIKFELHGGKADEKITQEYKVRKYCKENPITIAIQHDMTKPFFRTQYVKMKCNDNMKIAAVALRSPKYFDPVGLQQCAGI